MGIPERVPNPNVGHTRPLASLALAAKRRLRIGKIIHLTTENTESTESTESTEEIAI